MKKTETIKFIVDWIKNYKETNNLNGFVVGVSGGVDSALTSTLCALSGIKTLCLNMPIKQKEEQYQRAERHIQWLKKKFDNVESVDVNLTKVFNQFKLTVENNSSMNKLALANTRSRIRMMTLYYYATINNSIVVGTGNKVEDFGVGFYTKYGDGGVDISPIADLLKSEVFSLAKFYNIIGEIIDAEPNDGLWSDNRSDEDQIGASYDEIEKAMINSNENGNLSQREKEVLKIYRSFNTANKHKMDPIPVCKIPKKYLLSLIHI